MKRFSDTVISLLDTLCAIPSFWIDEQNQKKSVNELALAEYIWKFLEAYPYLTLEKQIVSDGRYNIFAYAGNVKDIELLIVGHLDTVRPSVGWSVEPSTVEGDKYYNIGATDTKDGIAATLDAISKSGPLDRVGFLFYVDEEYYFKGMEKFAEMYPIMQSLKYILSTCGAYAKYQDGCRGCYEFEFVIEGVAGHAARSSNGRNAIEALHYVYEKLKAYVTSFDAPYSTSSNLAGVSGGSKDKSVTVPTVGSTPSFVASGNKIPDIAWGKVDVRPGSSELTMEQIKNTMESALEEWNDITEGPPERARITEYHVALAYPGYSSRAHGTDNPIFEAFHTLHSQNGEHDPALSGYVDAAILADLYPDTTCVLMGPIGGNQHKSDEWTSISSTIQYRDCMETLLKKYRT